MSEFYPTTFSVVEKDKKCYVRMFGRDSSKKVVCVQSEYNPYFFVVGSVDQKELEKEEGIVSVDRKSVV